MFFFHEKISHAQKTQKTHISKQKQKKVVLNALNKHLRGRKLLIHLFLRIFFALFVLFLCVKDNIFMCLKTSKKKKVTCLCFMLYMLFVLFMRIKHLSENHLTFCVFYAFYAFCAFKKHLSESCFLCFLHFLCS